MLMQGFKDGVLPLFGYAMLLLAVVAFVLAAVPREDAYRAADKQTKTFWLVVLGMTVVVDVFLATFWFLTLAGLVASIVFMVDVRPALKQVSGGRGGRRKGGSSSDGPYGPYNGGR
ncbi:DUF2516 family protein [Streptomyces sp. NBC_00249]|uniref:DUF2516 family protein n=1 Tax=Streptomyces sp. NBC_00249 TaxID=2975690 RepID=UPI002251D4DA|nr:DUF2516 family protein [Streptomyces sp. NBC_00249]MCX5198758.1 DUF2516 family protein [Streptomyces sp. NBC_00249]